MVDKVAKVKKVLDLLVVAGDLKEDEAGAALVGIANLTAKNPLGASGVFTADGLAKQARKIERALGEYQRGIVKRGRARLLAIPDSVWDAAIEREG